MTTRDTAPEPRHDTTDTSTDRPRRFDRITSTVAWYTPELTGMAASAGAAATVWAPLGAIGVALAGWIATDQVKIARERHRHRQAIAARDERAQLDPAANTDDADASGDSSHGGGSETTDEGEASGAESESGGPADGERPGWEVSA